MELDPWKALKQASSLVSSTDINYSKILAAKKSLELIGGKGDPITTLCLLASNGDLAKLASFVKENRHRLNDLDKSGLSPLVFAICFNHQDCMNLLISSGADVNQEDLLLGWTPVMWATYLSYQPLVTDLLSAGADPLKKSSKGTSCAVDLATPGSEMFNYYQTHGLLSNSHATDLVQSDDNSLHSLSNDLEDKSFSREDTLYKSSNFNPADENLDVLVSGKDELFDFSVILPGQYVQFFDENIPQLIDYIFSLPEKYSHNTVYPAAIIYQCLRYASSKLESSGLVLNFLRLFLTRVRTFSNSTGGITTLEDANNLDILQISYWLSVLNFVYYYLLKDGACQFFVKYPQLLQELVDCIQAVQSQLAFSINYKLSLLVDECMLNYHSVPDLDNVVFKSDWKLFKNRKNIHKSTYEEIIEMLYPPSAKEQMKPSPIKVIQTLGALMYVLDLHNVNELMKQQTLSQVLYWLGSTMFNKVLSTKKYHTRLVAMQIRLNISTVEDWLRTNNLKPHKIQSMTFQDEGFPESIVDNQISLRNVTRFKGQPNNSDDSSFYYSNLFSIGKHMLLPLIELLQFIQVASSLGDEDMLKKTLDSFKTLTPVQLLKISKSYKYEIEEQRIDKKLIVFLKSILDSTDYPRDKNIHFKSSEEKLFLNENYISGVVLPNLLELTRLYSCDDHGNFNDGIFSRFQPTLPLEIEDDLFNIAEQERDTENDPKNERDYDTEGNNVQINEVFSDLQMPTSAVHKTWEEDNPWAS
ncbi:BA75_03589T0 [Komagataella pastoris]|uniref:BA75_03589T0 n=1 Tax=Komagataella pastoris TaxID=4922 RepID=A0A1B2JF21_PICPA|nr:BA75_03589T0 [Komagataella pastoris]